MNIFKNITEESVQRMLACFEAKTRTFAPGETIRTYSDHITDIGVMFSGKAHLYFIDYEGDMQILEYYEKDDVFGELFTLPVGSLEYIIEADTDCRVCFIPYSHITSPCENACRHHTELTRNLFFMTAKKSQELGLRISFISRKTIRQKLLTYFEYMSDMQGSDTIRAHTSLAKLSEYLCADRTSLMRELKHMNDDGIIRSKGRNVTLLQR